ncbi:MAG TPA: SPOR domain-containing protein [Ignavibacteriaceae bacterium]|nr:SPOR domain-containing protein [Ignavibacteriaceae bacterium]
MKIYSATKISLLIPAVLYLISCSASTSDRFKTTTKDSQKELTPKENNFEEDFDFFKYRPPFQLPEPNIATKKNNSEIWYEFNADTNNINKEKTISGTTSGFRVQVLSTDDLDEANQMRSKIYFGTDQKDVYVIFDPPFYKVQIGDFTNSADADNLSFKLRQLGYSEARSVNETINLFK